MGFISDSVRSAYQAKEMTQEAMNRSRREWREAFGTDKESKLQGPGTRVDPREANHNPNSWINSASSRNAQKRLLAALRSEAPGGWTDDRWTQSRVGWTGISYIAGHRTCEQMAQAEFQVYEKDDNHQDGKRPVKRWEQSYELVKLLEHPNQEDSFGDMMYRTGQQMMMTGSSLAWMVENQLKKPYQIFPLATAVMVPQPVMNPEYPEGFYRVQPLYPYGPFSSYPTPFSSVGAPIPAEWVLRVLFPHPLLRYEGYSPLTALAAHIDEVTMIDRSRTYKMKRSINPSAVLQMEEMEGAEPLPEPEIERIKAEMENNFEGPDNHGNLYVATPGCRLEEWGRSPADMEYQAGWEQLTSFVLAGLGITKPAAGMVDDASYSTLFATLKQFHLLTLQPMLNRIAARFTRRLAKFFGDALIVEIRCPRIDDHDIQNAKLDLLAKYKALKKNELRRELDFPVDEVFGDEICGDPSAAEQEQQKAQMEQEQLMAEQGMQEEEGNEEDPMAQKQEAETEKDRPRPANLSRGALGPRKHLLNGHTNGFHRR